jgi:hypothetical protein
MFRLSRPSGRGQSVVSGMTALRKKHRTGEISASEMNKAIRCVEREYPNKFVLIDVMPPVIYSAGGFSKRFGSRGYDPAQLAAALSANRMRQNAAATALEFISADNNFNNSMTSESLRIDKPNYHP